MDIKEIIGTLVEYLLRSEATKKYEGSFFINYEKN